MNGDLRYYEAIAEKAPERRNKRTAKEAETLRRIRHEKIAAGVALPPTDLYKLARYLDVSDVRAVPLAMKGRLVVEADAIAIEVNSDLPEFEKRYTIAHELAHLILEEKRLAISCLTGERTWGQRTSPYFLIEDLCDISAEEILLPVQWLRNRIRSYFPSFELAEKVSKEVNCALEFVVKRLIKLGLWNCRLLWFEKRGNKICVTKMFPPVDESFLALVGALDVEASLPGKCLIKGTILEGNLRLEMKDGDYVYRAQCIALSEQVVLSMLIYTH